MQLRNIDTKFFRQAVAALKPLLADTCLLALNVGILRTHEGQIVLDYATPGSIGTSIRITIPGEIVVPGQVLLNLHSIGRILPTTPRFTIEASERRIIFSTKQHQFTTSELAITMDDLPWSLQQSLVDTPCEEFARVNRRAFLVAFSRAKRFVAGNDETRSALHYVTCRLDAVRGTLKINGTNGRFGFFERIQLTAQETCEPHFFCFNETRTIERLLKLSNEAEVTFEKAEDGNVVCLTSGPVQLVVTGQVELPKMVKFPNLEEICDPRIGEREIPVFLHPETVQMITRLPRQFWSAGDQHLVNLCHFAIDQRGNVRLKDGTEYDFLERGVGQIEERGFDPGAIVYGSHINGSYLAICLKVLTGPIRLRLTRNWAVDSLIFETPTQTALMMPIRVKDPDPADMPIVIPSPS